MTTPGRPIDFPRYAELTAYLARFPADQGDEVLARLGHDRRSWQSAVTRWTAARDAEIERGGADLALRFGTLLSRARERLARERPPLESLGPLPPPPPSDPPVPEVRGAPPAPASVAPPPIQMSSGQLGAAPPPVPGMPSFLAQAHPPYSERPASAPPPSMRIEMPVALVASPQPPAAPGLASTMPLGASLPLPSKLPFQTGTPDQALAGALAHAQAVQGAPDTRRRAAMLGGTVAAPSNPAPAAALPFQGGPPPVAPGAPGIPELTLSQYASLRVELQAHAENAPAILVRYGVPAGGRAAVDAAWRARFDADPALRMEFARTYAVYTAWLRDHPEAASR